MAVALPHGRMNHERAHRAGEMARPAARFRAMPSVEACWTIELVSHTRTAVVGACPLPPSRRFAGEPGPLFNRANGGLTDAARVHGRDPILSGPVGGPSADVRHLAGA